MRNCPYCGQTMPRDAMASQIAAKDAELRADCAAHGETITGDGRIREGILARILTIDENYLARLRYEGKAPPHAPRGPGRGRVTYFISDVAEWLVRGME